MTEAEAVRGIRGAAKRRDNAAKARKAATDDLRRWVSEAQGAGVSISQIAREAGLSRQGVYDLISAQPSR